MKWSGNVKVGIFIIAGILLFSAGLFVIGNRNQVFTHHYDIYTQFANVDTLVSGAKIRVSGMDAGEVSEISIPSEPSSNFRLKLHVDDKFRDLIRADSVASIETEGMVGNKFVNIKKGTNGSPECSAGCTIPSHEPFEISDLMKQGKDLATTLEGTIQDVQHHADHALDKFASVGGHVDTMIGSVRGDVERIASNGARITNGVNSIVSGVQAGHGTVGELLSDDQMAKKVDETIAQAKQTSTNIEQASDKAKDLVAELQKENIPQDVHQTLENARDTSQQIRGAVGDFLSGGTSGQSTATTLRETVDQAQRATHNLAADTEAIKHNFFLRGFFHRRGYYNLNSMNRTEYASSEFVRHPKKRIWLPAQSLFTTGPKGAQELTTQGQSTLENAISKVADYLPNNPIMVEGYADDGSAAERYMAALQRADDVKQYLESRFQLKPDLIGIIPLEDKPPPSTGLESWNGVCLSVVISGN